jgi:hypothetical protein
MGENVDVMSREEIEETRTSFKTEQPVREKLNIRTLRHLIFPSPLVCFCSSLLSPLGVAEAEWVWAAAFYPVLGNDCAASPDFHETLSLLHL